jgi:hypothetical protein
VLSLFCWAVVYSVHTACFGSSHFWHSSTRARAIGLRPAGRAPASGDALDRAGDAWLRKGAAAALRTLQSDLVAKLVWPTTSAARFATT